MTENQSIGQSITEAVRFLAGIHNDLHALLTTLDETMQQEGWHPTRTSRVTEDLKCTLDPDCWVVTSLFRIYAPAECSGNRNTARALAVQIALNPPSSYEQAVCLLIVASFNKPVPFKDLWDKWDCAGSERVLEHIASKTGWVQLSPQVIADDFLPDVTNCHVHVLPLEDLTSAAALQEHIVRPMLDKAASLKVSRVSGGDNRDS